jgi:acetyltransferase-like isoleucine patch superfamily enzyme
MWRLIRYDLPLHFILLLSNWLPDNVVFIRFRGRLARPFFKSCGQRLGIGRNVTFYDPSLIEIGNDVYIAYGSWFLGSGGIVIEDEVLFAPYVVVSTGNHTKINDSFRFGPSKEKKIIIKKGSWIGAHVSLLIGSEVGSGVVIGANSVLNIFTEDNALYAGAPAKFIKKFDNERK